MKNPDSKTGDKDESICKIPPIDNDTPGSKFDNIDALTNFVYADSCGWFWVWGTGWLLVADILYIICYDIIYNNIMFLCWVIVE